MTLAGQPLSRLAENLAAGATTSRAMVESCLASIAVNGRAFSFVDHAAARSAADESDRLRSAGGAPTAYAGIPISIKDLFDLAGQPTAAGAKCLRDAPRESADAPIVGRLRAAGFIIIGRTQMSEFAFTGLGLNPHQPQPVNPQDPRRVPGGSSGGAAVSVALGQAGGAIGTDTGGSVRIPAAFCGLTGFKPTQRRISRVGAFPLSPSLDSIGPIGHTVSCCEILDAVMADQPTAHAAALALSDLRLGVPNHLLLEAMAPEVAEAWGRALSLLSRAGARIETFDFPELDQIPQINARGTISNAEAFAFHRRQGLLDQRAAYDPNVLARIEMGATMSAADYLDLLEARAGLIAAAAGRTAPFAAVISPTTPVLAPRLDEIATPTEFARQNALVLRNPSVANLLDRCAISLPMACDAAPCGLMLMGDCDGDARLLSIAQAVEGALIAAD